MCVYNTRPVLIYLFYNNDVYICVYVYMHVFSDFFYFKMYLFLKPKII
jgi:hypothetical protein